MIKTLLAIATVAMLASSSAWAKPHHQITDAQYKHCLTTDNDPDGTKWCIKYDNGMTEAQIEAWYAGEGKNVDINAQRKAEWQANAPAEASQRAYAAKAHHALNSEIMAQCNRMWDTQSIDWAQVAAFRGVTVSIEDCTKAAAGLAAEYGK